MTGSAPISQDTLAYFMSVNIPIYELYGMSECCGCCTVTTGDIIRFKSTGIPLPGVELRVSDVQGSDSGEVRNNRFFLNILFNCLIYSSSLGDVV